MHFSPLTLLSLPLFLTTSLSKASAIATSPSPSGPGIIQIQNGTHVYGCINSDSLFVPVEDEGGEFPQCNIFTANATTGRIGWQGVFLGIPDAFPQPLLLFADEGKGIQWTFAPNSEIPGLLFQVGIEDNFQVWAMEVIPESGSAQALFAAQGAPSTPEGGFLVWVPK